MRDFGAMRGAPWTVGDILRRMLLSWLTAVLVQYLSLRAELRGLEGLEGLAAQSVLLLLGMAAFLFVLLSLLARRFETLRLERWPYLWFLEFCDHLSARFLRAPLSACVPVGFGCLGCVRLAWLVWNREGGPAGGRPGPRWTDLDGSVCDCVFYFCEFLDGVPGLDLSGAHL